MKTKPSKIKRTSSRRRALASTRFRIGRHDTDIRDYFRKHREMNKSEWIKDAIRSKIAFGDKIERVEQKLDLLVSGMELKAEIGR